MSGRQGKIHVCGHTLPTLPESAVSSSSRMWWTSQLQIMAGSSAVSSSQPHMTTVIIQTPDSEDEHGHDT